MSEPITEVKVGQQVPDFEITVYEPENHDFGKRSLAQLKNINKLESNLIRVGQVLKIPGKS